MKVQSVAFLLCLLILTACGQPAGDATKTKAVADSLGNAADRAAAFDLSQKWSRTQPAVNLHHVFLGEINRSGNPTGFHSRPGGQDPAGARIKRISQKPNRLGVYTATVEIFDQGTGQWKEKFSSLFPDNLSHEQVISAILNAYQKRNQGRDQPWSGPSGLGFEIQGYTLDNNSINTAFPVFARN